MVKLGDVLNKARNSVAYLAEALALDFTAEIDRLMRARNINRTELAKRVGVSPAYITKVLRGDANFTVKTMAALADAVGARIAITVFDRQDAIEDAAWVTVGEAVRAEPLFLKEIAANDGNEWQTLQAA